MLIPFKRLLLELVIFDVAKKTQVFHLSYCNFALQLLHCLTDLVQLPLHQLELLALFIPYFFQLPLHIFKLLGLFK